LRADFLELFFIDLVSDRHLHQQLELLALPRSVAGHADDVGDQTGQAVLHPHVAKLKQGGRHRCNTRKALRIVCVFYPVREPRNPDSARRNQELFYNPMQNALRCRRQFPLVHEVCGHYVTGLSRQLRGGGVSLAPQLIKVPVTLPTREARVKSNLLQDLLGWPTGDIGVTNPDAHHRIPIGASSKPADSAHMDQDSTSVVQGQGRSLVVNPMPRHNARPIGLADCIRRVGITVEAVVRALNGRRRQVQLIVIDQKLQRSHASGRREAPFALNTCVMPEKLSQEVGRRVIVLLPSRVNRLQSAAAARTDTAAFQAGLLTRKRSNMNDPAAALQHPPSHRCLDLLVRRITFPWGLIENLRVHGLKKIGSGSMALPS
jgi:hypothetical protein